MPAYNAAPFISQSIQSIINQSHENWELIIINDGSIDITEDIVLEFMKFDNRIKLLSKKNAGVASARNDGINYASGEYFAFLDSDDIWNNEFLALNLQHTKYSKLIFSRYNLIHNQFNIRPRFLKKSGFIAKNKILKNNPIGTLTVFVHKNIISCNRFDEDLFGPEDWDLWLTLSKKYDWYFADFCAAKYRMHVNGISRSALRMYKQELIVLKKHTIKDKITTINKIYLYLRLIRRLTQ